MSVNRVIVIVLDGVGVGAAPDADLYGDLGSNSIGNTSRAVGGLNLPNLFRYGLGNLTEIVGVPPNPQAAGAYGRLQEKSAGKDTITGHWELMGIYLERPMPVYPNGFPANLLAEFTRLTGRGVIGNKPASGTQVIQELGEEHMRTGSLIVYTSADSVFQIAAHEDIVSIEELYHVCEIARGLLVGEHQVGRVIARPFVGEPGRFTRTERRRDYPLPIPGRTVLDSLVAHGRQVYSVGKIDQVFNYQGISHSNHTVSNADGIQALLTFLEEDFSGLLFVNLVEFDMIYGHRNDPRGYADALEYFDQALPEITRRMRPGDIVMIVGDHGVDPTTPSTDHSREYVPLLVFGEPVIASVNLGTRATFADVAATIAAIFALPAPAIGVSFLAEITGHAD